MIHDALGKGQHVQHCLVENERKGTLRTACEQFKVDNPCYDSVSIIIIDKEFTDLRTISWRTRFVCHFYEDEASKEGHNVGSWTKNEMKRVIQLLVRAPTEAGDEKAEVKLTKAENPCESVHSSRRTVTERS
ncbi:hypothetical protein PHMEG_0005310 [Phytophthora megakarya]|uniref:ZSWIM1/3 RNaseH-like domain-containing protein n=1 Tax=Phytophthora megakarya TaxID=4795 RepID=A0A225WRM3_9STRA|nr:hypothetical protein PHMEG_0005310 [Phytophthora megakarya]